MTQVWGSMALILVLRQVDEMKIRHCERSELCQLNQGENCMILPNLST